MPPFLIATKLMAPQARPGYVPRPRLMEKLATGLARLLTLVSAPPGFGKTALVAAWLDQQQRNTPREGVHPSNVAYLSLDEGDSDPITFFSYLVVALQSVDPSLGQGIQSMLGSPQPLPVEMVAASLVNDLAGSSSGVILVLDDYHLVQSESVHQAVALLVERQPPNLRLVLLTREDPPLPLARLRARGEVTEIREADLRFTLEEAAAFLNRSMGLDLSAMAVASLDERTEGWIAGLQMAALALQASAAAGQPDRAEAFIGAFRGDDRFIMDYLLEEVFSRQTEEIQSFLLKTSILERLCAPLCDAIIKDGPRSTQILTERGEGSRLKDEKESLNIIPHPASPDSSMKRGHPSAFILDFLDRSNLFIIPLDNRREWYRYHQLFADLLRYRLQQERPGSVADLHRRASDWFAQAGEADEAIRHAFAAGDAARAAALAEENLLAMIGSSRIATYLSWIRRIPLEEIRRRAFLCVGCSWAAVLTGQTDAAADYADLGAAALDGFEPLFSRPEGRWIGVEEARGHLMAVRAYIERNRGDYPAAAAYCRQALEILPVRAFTIRCIVSLTLGLICLAREELEPARAAFLEALAMAQKSAENLYVAITALALLGEIAGRQGHLDQAEDYARQAIRLGTAGGKGLPIPAVGYAHGGLVAVHYQRHELEEAEAHLEKTRELVEKLGSLENLGMVAVYRALLRIERGQLDAAGQALDGVEAFLPSSQANPSIRAEWAATRARLLLARGDARGCIRWLESQLEPVGKPEDRASFSGLRKGCPPQTLAQHLLLARAWQATGSTDAAGSLLEQVVEIAGTCSHHAILLEGLVFQAVSAWSRPGGQGVGLERLKRALDQAAPQQYVQPFLEAGEALVPLLRQAAAQGIQPGYAARLLKELAERERTRAVSREIPAGTVSTTPGSDGPVEPLTEREQQVLRLLAAGMSSVEIASQLVISASTVRSYIKNLYQKLDAHSRDQAVETGHRLGLL